MASIKKEEDWTVNEKYKIFFRIQVIAVLYIILKIIDKIIGVPTLEFIFLIAVIYLFISKKLDFHLFFDPSFHAIIVGFGLFIIFIQGVYEEYGRSMFSYYEAVLIFLISLNSFFILRKGYNVDFIALAGESVKKRK